MLISHDTFYCQINHNIAFKTNHDNYCAITHKIVHDSGILPVGAKDDKCFILYAGKYFGLLVLERKELYIRMNIAIMIL